VVQADSSGIAASVEGAQWTWSLRSFPSQAVMTSSHPSPSRSAKTASSGLRTLDLPDGHGRPGLADLGGSGVQVDAHFPSLLPARHEIDEPVAVQVTRLDPIGPGAVGDGIGRIDGVAGPGFARGTPGCGNSARGGEKQRDHVNAGGFLQESAFHSGS
jgi:hypothetical protein